MSVNTFTQQKEELLAVAGSLPDETLQQLLNYARLLKAPAQAVNGAGGLQCDYDAALAELWNTEAEDEAWKSLEDLERELCAHS